MKPIPFMYKGTHVSLIIDGKTKIITKDDLNFIPLIDALKKGNWELVQELSDVKQVIVKMSNGRVKIHDDGTVLLDNKPIKNALTVRMITMLEEGFDVSPLMKFLENVNDNPLDTAKDELYLFLEACNIPITDDGHFLAYKSVREDYKDIYTGTFDNFIGRTVSMPREQVNHSRYETCQDGLHVCSESYIPQYGGGVGKRVVIVKVNPKDVVAVPSDYHNAKMRVCEYLVVDELKDWYTDRLKSHFVSSEPPTVYGEDTHTEDDVDFEDPDFEDDDTDDETLAEYKAWVNADSGRPVVAAASDDLPQAKVDQIKKVRLMGGQKFTKTAIAEVTGLSRRQVGRILTGEAWKTIK